METFSALLAICAGNSPVHGEFPAQRPVTRSFDVFFDVRPNKQLSKQSWGWWSETLSPSLWRHRNVIRFHSLKSCHYVVVKFDTPQNLKVYAYKIAKPFEHFKKLSQPVGFKRFYNWNTSILKMLGIAIHNTWAMSVKILLIYSS